jgi:hypothetical protein
MGHLRSVEDVEAMMGGLEPEARARVIAGALEDTRADLERRYDRQFELLERLEAILECDG